MSGFVHEAGIYDSAEEFLAMATPFIGAGLDAGEPVLVTTTSANLDLLGRALGRRARDIDYAETAHFGRRPAQRVTAFHRYWRRHAADHFRVRVLAEPVWTGRSAADTAAWQRMESALNVVLAETAIHMICPYDRSQLPPEIVDGALRTHPEFVAGLDRAASAEYTDPHAFITECDTRPLPPHPSDAAEYSGTDPRTLRSFVAAQAGARGLPADRVAMIVLAAGECAAYLGDGGSGPMTARIWDESGRIVCDMHQPGGRIGDPVVGLTPPGLESGPGDGVWTARQVCDRLELRATDSGATARLYLPGPRAEELAQAGALFTA